MSSNSIPAETGGKRLPTMLYWGSEGVGDPEGGDESGEGDGDDSDEDVAARG